MRMSIVILLLVIIGAIAIWSCNGDSESWKYLGQTPPGETAQLFAPEIIKHLAHSSPTFTPDGKEILWSTVSENNEPRTIYRAVYENNNWTAPKKMSFSGQYHDDQPFVTSDGQKLYFASKRPKSPDGPQKMDIWISSKTDRGWGAPEPIENLTGFWTPSLTRTGTIYYLDVMDEYEAKGYRHIEKIYRSVMLNGEYSTPEMLPEIINQKNSQNWCPFITPDEKYIIFSSDREGGYGSGDLYISFRAENGNWGKPINMGESINTSKQERFPGVSPDGKYLFFTRSYGGPNLHDLYWIDAVILNDYREQAQ